MDEFASVVPVSAERIIEVRTVFDSNATNALLRFQFRRMRGILLLLSFAVVCLGLIMLIGALTDEEAGTGGIVISILLMLFGLLYAPLAFVFSRMAQKSMGKTMQLLNAQTVTVFRFGAKKMYEDTRRDDAYKSITESDYSLLFTAFETKTHFFLYISNRQAHVIPKKDFTDGTPDELSNLFYRVLGAKKFRKIGIK